VTQKSQIYALASAPFIIFRYNNQPIITLMTSRTVQIITRVSCQGEADLKPSRVVFVCQYLPITYYWTVPQILDHSFLVGKLTSSKTADTKVSGF
jgi:hypothetical protein